MSKRVIVIDDDLTYCQIIKRAFKDALDYRADATQSELEMYSMIEAAEKANDRYEIATIDMDFKLPNSRDEDPHEPLGRQILKTIKARFPYIICVMISGAMVSPTDALILRDLYGLDFFIMKNRFEPMIFKTYIQHAVENRGKELSGKNPAKSAFSSTPKKEVFISYRRNNTWGQARAIANSLRDLGVDVFLDVDSIGSGDFPPYIIKAIVQREFFVILLAEGSLDSEWVQKELNYALDAGKKIIPVLLNGFELNERNLPSQFLQLQRFNALKVSPESYQGNIERLVQVFLAANV